MFKKEKFPLGEKYTQMVGVKTGQVSGASSEDQNHVAQGQRSPQHLFVSAIYVLYRVATKTKMFQ